MKCVPHFLRGPYRNAMRLAIVSVAPKTLVAPAPKGRQHPQEQVGSTI